MERDKNLKGKTVVITGASSGIGRAAAEAFALEGANVILAARGEEGLHETERILRSLDTVTLSVPTDVTKREDLENLAEKAKQFNGRIDVWINNAGVMATGKIEDMPKEALDKIIATNLTATLHASQIVLPIFKNQGDGVFMTNISVGGNIPVPYGTAYSASKYGLKGLMSALESEVSEYPGIHLVSLYPGMQRSTGNEHSAKYSGFDLKIPPLSFDPRVLAEKMVVLSKNPKKKAYTDYSSYLLKAIYDISPKAFTALGSFATRLLMDPKNGETNGNLFAPSRQPHRIYGETLLPVPSKETKKLALAGSLFLGAILFFKISEKKPSKKKRSKKR